MEKTLVLIKPDGVKRNLEDEIIGRFEKEGLKVIEKKTTEANSEILKKHYSEHIEKPFYKGLEEFMMEGPIVAMIIEGENAVSEVRRITGSTDPTQADEGTVRGDLGEDSFEKADSEGRAVKNLIHASGTKDEAEKEINIWFG